MANLINKFIKDWIPKDSKVIDFGCGDGSLLKDLVDTKNISGYGVEIDHKKIEECILPEETKKTFSNFVKQGELPNIILSANIFVAIGPHIIPFGPKPLANHIFG